MITNEISASHLVTVSTSIIRDLLSLSQNIMFYDVVASAEALFWTGTRGQGSSTSHLNEAPQLGSNGSSEKIYVKTQAFKHSSSKKAWLRSQYLYALDSLIV